MPKKKTYEEVKQYIESYGYILVSTEYKNNSSELNTICPEGHPYIVSYGKFKSGCRCSECAGNKKYTLEEVKQYYHDHGCELLTDIYVGANKSMPYKCICGNKSTTSFSHFKNGKRCRKCMYYRRNNIDLKDIKEYTRDDLISEFYRFTEENGRYPRTNDMRIKNGYPSFDFYCKEWGTWNDFLREINVLGDNGWYKCDEQVLIEMYETEPKKKIMSSLMIKRKWEAIIKKANDLGLTRDSMAKIGKTKLTKQYLIDCFWDFYNKSGKYPTTVDFRKNSEYPWHGHYNKFFGTWENFLKEIDVLGEDGWYKCDEQVLIELYKDSNRDEIIEALMIKRIWGTIIQKASSMGLSRNRKSKYDSEKIKELIKQNLIEIYKLIGETPKISDLDFPKNALKVHWSSYNELLEECNIPIVRREVNLKSKEDGINFLLELANEIGKIPTVDDVFEYGINKDWFARRFGTYKQALFESGLIEEIEALSGEEKINISIEGLKELYKEMNRCPSYREYQEYASKNKLYSANVLIDYYEKTFSEICFEQLGVANYCVKDKETLLKELIDLKYILNRVPMAKELEENGLENYQVYTRIFGKFYSDIIKDLGWEPSGHVPVYKNEDEMLEDYHNLFQKLGRMPLREDIDKEEGMTSSVTYIKKFGSLFNVCELLDIDFREYVSDIKMGYGMTCLDNNGELCRSYAEMIITNLFIDNDKMYIKEYGYNNFIPKSRDRFDWYFTTEDIAVEYFGLFNTNALDKMGKQGDYSRKTIKKINTCKENDILLIDLYPEDLKNNFKGLITKFKLFGINIKINVNLPVAS